MPRDEEPRNSCSAQVESVTREEFVVPNRVMSQQSTLQLPTRNAAPVYSTPAQFAANNFAVREQLGAYRELYAIDGSSTVFPLAEAAAAHAYIESRQAFGRVVLTP